MTKFHFDVEDKIKLFNDPVYTQYLQFMGDMDRIQIDKNGTIIAHDMSINPPVLVSIENTLEDLVSKRRELMRSVHDVYLRIIHDDNDADHFKEQYEQLLEKIYTLDSLSDKIQAFYERTNQTRKDALSNLQDKYQRLLLEMDNENSAKNRIKLYKRAVKLGEQLREFKISDNAVNYYIDTLPKFAPRQPRQSKEPPKQPKQTKPDKKKDTKSRQSREPPHVKLTDDQIDQNVAKLIREKFPFTSKEECTSSKRTSSFYMSKEDITKNIKSDPKLKKLMPRNYSTLTKKELCDHLFF